MNDILLAALTKPNRLNFKVVLDILDMLLYFFSIEFSTNLKIDVSSQIAYINSKEYF